MDSFKCIGCGEMKPKDERNRVSVSVQGIPGVAELCDTCL